MAPSFTSSADSALISSGGSIKTPKMKRKNSAGNLLIAPIQSSHVPVSSPSSTSGHGHNSPPTSSAGPAFPMAQTPSRAYAATDGASVHSDLGTITPSAATASSAAPSITSFPQTLSGWSPQAAELLRELVQKRITTFNYLKKVHLGRVHYFNTILLSKEDLAVAFNNQKMKKRILRFTVLGMSLSTILEISSPVDFLRALLTLLSEMDAAENKMDEDYKPKMRNFFKSSKTNKRPSTGCSDYSVEAGTANANAGEFTYLFQANMPFQLDYCQVFLTLCDMLSEVYQRLSRFLGAPQPAPPAAASAHPPPPMKGGILSPTASVASPSSIMGTNASTTGSISSTSGAFPVPPGSTAFSSTEALGDFGAVGTEEASWKALDPACADMMLKADGKLKKILSTVTKELDAVARALIKEELTVLDPLSKDLAPSSAVTLTSPPVWDAM